jgi:hypothetical protein
LKILKIKSQGIEEKENSFMVQLQNIQHVTLDVKGSVMWRMSVSLLAARHMDSISLVFLPDQRFQPLHCLTRYLHSFFRKSTMAIKTNK